MATVTSSFKDLSREDGDIDSLIKRFRKEVEKEGILTTLKKRREFKKPSRIKYEHNIKINYKMRKKQRKEKNINENKGRYKGKKYIQQ